MADGFLQSFLEPWTGRWLYMDSAMWTAVGFLGAAIFGSRFILQWLKSEKEKKLVVPWYFWHLSFWGSVLNLLYFLHIDKAPLILGNCFLPFLYGRNIFFLRRTGTSARGGGRKVLAAVLILMTSAFAYTALTERDLPVAKDKASLNEMERAVGVFKAYYKEHGKFPPAAEVVTLAGADGVWKDAWGHPYRTIFHSSGMVLRCAGPNGVFDDGVSGNRDDILLEAGVP